MVETKISATNDRIATSPITFEGAFALSANDILAIAASIESYCGLKEISSLTSDGTTIKFNGPADLVGFPNTRIRHIVRVTVEGYSRVDDVFRSATIQLRSNDSPAIQGVISGLESEVLHVKRNLTEIIIEKKSRYGWLYKNRRFFFIDFLTSLFYSLAWSVALFFVFDIAMDLTINVYAPAYRNPIGIFLWGVLAMNFMRLEPVPERLSS